MVWFFHAESGSLPYRRYHQISKIPLACGRLVVRWEEGVPGLAPGPEFLHAHVQANVSQREEHPFHHLPELHQRDSKRPRELGQEGGLVVVVAAAPGAPKGLGGDYQRREAQPVDRPRRTKGTRRDRNAVVLLVIRPGCIYRARTVEIDHGHGKEDLGPLLLDAQEFVENVFEVRQEIGTPVLGPGPRRFGITNHALGVGFLAAAVAGRDIGIAITRRG